MTREAARYAGPSRAIAAHSARKTTPYPPGSAARRPSRMPDTTADRDRHPSPDRSTPAPPTEPVPVAPPPPRSPDCRPRYRPPRPARPHTLSIDDAPTTPTAAHPHNHPVRQEMDAPEPA